MKLTRRQILVATSAAAVLGGLTAGGTAVHWWDQPAGQQLAALSEDEARFARALADTFFPPGGQPTIGGAESGAVEGFDALLLAMEEDNRNILKIFLHTLDASTIATRCASFTKLSLEQRAEVLTSWKNHPITVWRIAIESLQILLGIGFTTHPDVAALIQPSFGVGYGR